MGHIARPLSLALPEGLSDGQSFDAVGTFVVHGENLTLVKIDGEVVPGYEKEAEHLDRGEPIEGDNSDDADPQSSIKSSLNETFASRRGY